MLRFFQKRYRLELFRRVKNKFHCYFNLSEPFHDVCFYLPLVYDHIQNIIINSRNFYEIKYLEIVSQKYIQKNSVVVDVGSNIGNHLVFFSKVTDAKKVYAFEPQKEIFNILAKNVALNKCEANIKNIALGDKCAKSKIDTFDKKNVGATTLVYSQEGTIDTSTLDNEFQNVNEKIDFIKIDVEGFEYEVINGAKMVLLHNQPILWVEIFNKNFVRVNTLLQSLNYEIKDCLGTYNYIYCPKEI